MSEDQKTDLPVAVLSSTEEQSTLGGQLLLVCLVLMVGLPLVGIGAGVAVVLFRGITGL